MLGQYRFRVKLNALDRELAMTHTHDLPIVAFGGDLQALGKRPAVDYQRMVAGRRERTRQPFEYPFASMSDGRQFAVHHAARPDDTPPERLADGLVPEAYPEDRNFAREALHQRHRDAGFVGRARARRDDDLLGSPRTYLLQVDRVVAMHVHVGAQLTQVLRQVVGERVVVVDQEQHVLALRIQAQLNHVRGALQRAQLVERL